MTIGEKIRSIREELTGIAGNDALFEAKQLISSVTVIPVDKLFLNSTKELNSNDERTIDEFVLRRKKREPLQYILGNWSFYGLDFAVSPGVLIPRQDTETLVESAISIIKTKHYRSLLDLCCGTGCIGTAVSVHTGISPVYSDISPICIDIAKYNAQRNGVNGSFYCGDLFQPLTGLRFDMICVNPPYLSESDMRLLQPEVEHEPNTALYGGIDGCDFYRRIASEYVQFLNPSGCLLMEIGYDQAMVSRLFPGSEILKDINEKPRIIKVFAE